MDGRNLDYFLSVFFVKSYKVGMTCHLLKDHKETCFHGCPRSFSEFTTERYDRRLNMKAASERGAFNDTWKAQFTQFINFFSPLHKYKFHLQQWSLADVAGSGTSHFPQDTSSLSTEDLV